MFQFYLSSILCEKLFPKISFLFQNFGIFDGLITVGMCAADISKFQFFWPQNIFTTSLRKFNQSSIHSIAFLSYLMRNVTIKTKPTTQTNQTTMNFLLMLASLMALLVSVASDTTYPILGTTRTFYPSDEYTVTFSLTAFWPRSPPLAQPIMWLLFSGGYNTVAANSTTVRRAARYGVSQTYPVGTTTMKVVTAKMQVVAGYKYDMNVAVTFKGNKSCSMQNYVVWEMPTLTPTYQLMSKTAMTEIRCTK